MQLGDKIKAIRMAHNLSQEKIADEMKISRNTLAAYERNEQSPRVRDLQEFCRVYEYDIRNFFEDTVVFNNTIKKPPMQGIKILIEVDTSDPKMVEQVKKLLEA